MKNKKLICGTILLLFTISGICNISYGWTETINLDPSQHAYYYLGYLHDGAIIHINEVSSDGNINVYIMNDEDFDEIGGIVWDYIIRWQDITYLSNYDYDVTVYDEYYIVFRNWDIFDDRMIQVDIEVERVDITITSPIYYDTFVSGYNDITWTSTGSFDYVKMELYKDGYFLETIVTWTYNDGSYSWYIYDDDYTDDSDYQIRISNYYDNSIYDYSSYFTMECEIDPYDPYDPTDYSYIVRNIFFFVIIPVIVGIIIIGYIAFKKKHPKEPIIQIKEIPKITYCPECGSKIIDTTKDHCPQCGSKIKN